jgi:hypothetical protein
MRMTGFHRVPARGTEMHTDMPQVYPNGGPLYWLYEQSGVLPAAVRAYAEKRETPEQFALMRAYCRYWIDAPCWREEPGETALQTLRETIRGVSTRETLDAWYWDAVVLGIDPL